MPKKTKKEKIIAEYRKKLRLLENRPLPIPTSAATTTKLVEVKQTVPVVEKNLPLSQEDSTTRTYFFSDLRKSLIIIVSMIALEIGLYFATMLIHKL